MKTNAVRNPDGWWINSSVFSEEAQHFNKHGYYCAAPWGSKGWRDYWTEQLRRCREGYESGGVKITGHHYNYLNFSPIIRKQDTGADRVGFPDFWDYDYNFFWMVEIARYGISREDLKKLNLEIVPLDIGGGKHLGVAKARQKGYSVKDASIVANTYNTVRNSLCIIGASDKKYLYPTGTVGMATDYLNFYNEHTGWARKRDYVDKQDHKRASFKEEINGVPVERGFKSEFIGLTFKNNPNAARGKIPWLVLMEEAGDWPGLEDAYMATRPAVEAGNKTTGLIIIYGTGGESQGGTFDLIKMFYTPEAYNLLPFENVWDTDGGSETCGFFVPEYKNSLGFIDEQGNSLEEEAKAFEISEREKIMKAPDSAGTLAKRLSEHPFSPEEAFLSSSTNEFPVVELKKQLGRVRSHDLLRKKGQPVTLYWTEEGKVNAKPDLNRELIPIDSYIKSPKQLGGAVVVYEFPIPNAPAGLYKIGYDPYRHDQSQGPSLGAIYVYKSLNSFSFTGDTLVAEYVGRPQTVEMVHEIALQLSVYYNTQVMFENEVTSVRPYFHGRKKLQYLAPQPDDVISAIVKSSKVSRKYGVHMSGPIKEAVIGYIKSWLLTEREEGMLNLHTIYSTGLLEELIHFNQKDNFDRIMALGMVMIQIQEEKQQPVYERKRENIVAKQLLELQEERRTRWNNPISVSASYRG